MVTEFGIMGTPKNFEALFDGFDTDEDGVISLKEFVLLIHVMSDETPEEKIKWAFTTYDENKDGLELVKCHQEFYQNPKLLEA